MKNYEKLLVHSKLFCGIRETDLESMLECLGPVQREYRKGEYIYYAGEHITSAGMVLRGCVHVLKEDYWGNRTILAEISAGQLFGEAYACAGRKEPAVGVVAAADCAVLFLNMQRVLSLCSSACVFHTRLIQNLITVLADKNVYLTDKIEYLSRRRLRDKVLSYLSDMAKEQGGREFSIPFNRQELADYLSVDRSALSSELCKLRDEKILEFKKNHFRFL